MPKLSAFVFPTLNGRYKGEEEDINWHHHGAEEARFSEESLSADHSLVFGRRTYDIKGNSNP